MSLNFPIIDGHCHVGTDEKKKQDPEELLSRMDKCNIDKAIICPVDRFIAVLNKEGNNYIANTVKRYSDRFIGFATVNPWYREKGEEELKRALDKGLSGIKLNPSLQGFILNSQIVYPIIKIAMERKIPIYFHTGTPIHSLPFQLCELASHFNEVNFIMGHTSAYDFWYDVIPVAIRQSNIWFETSIATVNTIGSLIKKIGASRVIFGSDSPVSCQQLELEKIKLIGLSQDEERKILGGNISDLLGKNDY